MDLDGDDGVVKLLSEFIAAGDVDGYRLCVPDYICCEGRNVTPELAMRQLVRKKRASKQACWNPFGASQSFALLCSLAGFPGCKFDGVQPARFPTGRGLSREAAD